MERGFNFKLLVPPRVNPIPGQVSTVKPQEIVEDGGCFMQTLQQVPQLYVLFELKLFGILSIWMTLHWCATSILRVIINVWTKNQTYRFPLWIWLCQQNPPDQVFYYHMHYTCTNSYGTLISEILFFLHLGLVCQTQILHWRCFLVKEIGIG